MKAAVLREYNQPLSIEEVELLPPQEGEIKVRYAASGVCHSDLTRIQGQRHSSLPIVLGHEAAGTVVEVGPGVTSLAPGDHVVLSFMYTCGNCYYCHVGRPNLCQLGIRMLREGTMADGTTRLRKGSEVLYHMVVSSFAEYGIVPARCAVKIPEDVPLDKAALIGCGVLTGTGAVFNRAKVEAGSSVLVIGTGGVGLNAIQAAVIAGATKIIAVDISKTKLEMALEFGATHVIDASKTDPVQEAKLLTGSNGVDYAFEVIGNPVTIRQAYDATRVGGTTVVVGVAHQEAEVRINALEIPFQEKILTGSMYGGTRPEIDVNRLIELYRMKKLKLEPLVTKTYGLEEINGAFDDMEKGMLARGLIVY